MSGFSEDVAIAVTHPLWPSREPRKRSDSDILGCVRWVGRRPNLVSAYCVTITPSHRDISCTVPGIFRFSDMEMPPYLRSARYVSEVMTLIDNIIRHLRFDA